MKNIVQKSKGRFFTLKNLMLSGLIVFSVSCSDQEDEILLNGTAEAGTSITSQKEEPIVGGIYTITSVKSGRTLDISAGSNSNGANLQVWGTNENTSATHRQWEVLSTGGDYVRLKGVDSGKSLEVSAGNNSNGANVQQYEYRGHTHQQWEIKSVGNDEYRLKNRDSGKSLRVSGTKNGSNADQHAYRGWSSQKFYFTKVGGSSDNGGNGGDSDVDVPTGSDPWDFFENCNQWKITWVDGSEQKKLCTQRARSDQYFVSSDRKALVFKVQLEDGINSTQNSTYPRSELRERTTDGGSDVYWTTSGNHALYIQQAITHLPIEKDHIVTGQIHGNKDEGIDDSMVVRLEGKKLFLSFNGGKLRSDVTITNDYSLGTKMEVILQIINDKHYCYYSTDGKLRSAYNSGNASKYLVNGGSLMSRSYGDAYFKVGNYTQSNEKEEGSSFGKSNNYGEVYVYAFNVSHSGGKI